MLKVITTLWRLEQLMLKVITTLWRLKQRKDGTLVDGERSECDYYKLL